MGNKFQNPNLVIKNGALLLFRMLLALFLGFFATRITLQILGDEKFGIYNIVGGIIAIFAVVSLPIRDSLQRFFNVELAKEKYSPDIVFNTSTRIVVVMIITITILYETIGLYLVNNVINYPVEEKVVVNIIFQICALTNVFGFAELPYVSLMFSRENMSVPAICEITRSIVKISLLFLIPLIPVDSLISYSSIFLVLNIVVYLFYRFYCRQKYPEYFTSRNNDKGLRKNMLSFSLWSFIESVAGIAITYVSNLFINIFGGVLYNTAYGISKQVQSAVVSFSKNVVKASEPQITSGTTTNNTNYRDKLLVTTSKVSFLFISFAYLVIHFDGGLLIKFWLGKIPQYVTEFCEFMLLSIVFTSTASPFRTLIMATGKVKGYFSSYGVVSLISMILMFVLLKQGFPVITVMYIILVSEVTMFALAIYYSNKEAKLNLKYVFRNFFLSIIAITITAVIYYFSKSLIHNDVYGFVIPLIVSFIALVISTYYISFNEAEKNIVKEVLNKYNKRVCK